MIARRNNRNRVFTSLPMVVRILGIPNSPSANSGRNVSERCGEPDGNVRRTDNSTDSRLPALAQLIPAQAGEGWRRVSESNVVEESE